MSLDSFNPFNTVHYVTFTNPATGVVDYRVNDNIQTYTMDEMTNFKTNKIFNLDNLTFRDQNIFIRLYFHAPKIHIVTDKFNNDAPIIQADAVLHKD